ncbi:MAG: aspartate kinase [Thermoanaerobacteraceae bacterium]|nr:aspartate kinase [Thermoanaerobacteraceae bacterium]
MTNGKILVQKFGGTSVVMKEQCIKKVLDAISNGYRPVVVVSAIGRCGDPYATDTLIKLAKEPYDDVPQKDLDLIMSCGEIISSVIMAGCLRRAGLKSTALTGGQAGILTDDNYGYANVIRVKPDNLLALLNEGYVPVVTGFIGATSKGTVTTLGRGGSDITASLLGEALKAEKIEIYTDVDGVFTADPRIVPDARILKTVNYLEVLRLARRGAKVIHPKSVEIAMRSNIPLVVKNICSDDEGTTITYEAPSKEVVSITHLPAFTRISLTLSEERKRIYDEILNELAEENIGFDMINIFPFNLMFTIKESDVVKVKSILERYSISYNIVENCSRVSMVTGIRKENDNLLTRIVKTLMEKSIEPLQTQDQGNVITCLVKKEDTEKTILALHTVFV